MTSRPSKVKEAMAPPVCGAKSTRAPPETRKKGSIGLLEAVPERENR
jgi:hypothetical protein